MGNIMPKPRVKKTAAGPGRKRKNGAKENEVLIGKKVKKIDHDDDALPGDKENTRSRKFREIEDQEEVPKSKVTGSSPSKKKSKKSKRDKHQALQESQQDNRKHPEKFMESHSEEMEEVVDEEQHQLQKRERSKKIASKHASALELEVSSAEEEDLDQELEDVEMSDKQQGSNDALDENDDVDAENVQDQNDAVQDESVRESEETSQAQDKLTSTTGNPAEENQQVEETLHEGDEKESTTMSSSDETAAKTTQERQEEKSENHTKLEQKSNSGNLMEVKAPLVPSSTMPNATTNSNMSTETIVNMDGINASETSFSTSPLELSEAAREQLIEVTKEENLLFDKIRQEEAINACLRDPNEVTLEELTREPTRVEELFLELKSLRTTAVEFQLAELRKVANARCKAQDAIIQELRGEVKVLRSAVPVSTQASPDAQTEEIARLKAELLEAQTALASFGQPPAEESTESQGNVDGKTTTSLDEQDRSSPSDSEFMRLKNQLSAMRKVTGLTVAVSDNGQMMRCILRNKVSRKAVRYEFEQISEDDEESGVIYRPTGNIKFLPESMREELDVESPKDIPALQAFIQAELFCATGSS